MWYGVCGQVAFWECGGTSVINYLDMFTGILVISGYRKMIREFIRAFLWMEDSKNRSCKIFLLEK